MRGGPDAVPDSEREEFPAVVPGVGGDTAQFLLIEQLAFIVERRCVGQVDPGNGQDSATAKSPPPGPPPARTGARCPAVPAGSRTHPRPTRRPARARAAATPRRGSAH